MSTSQTVTAAERLQAQARLELLEALIADLSKRRDDLIGALQAPAAAPLPSVSSALEASLEGLSWTAAKSGKCDFTKNAPSDLVAAVRTSKNGFQGAKLHFTADNAELTLFMFARRTT